MRSEERPLAVIGMASGLKVHADGFGGLGVNCKGVIFPTLAEAVPDSVARRWLESVGVAGVARLRGSPSASPIATSFARLNP